MRKSVRAGLALVAIVPVLTAVVLSPPADAASGDAKVSVVHGIPNTPVNVFVDGKSTLQDFKPGSVAGPLDVPAGSHTVTVFPASDTKGTGTPVIKATADLQSGVNYSLVAHLTAGGKPTLTPYENDVAPIAAGKARLVVRHDAAAPAVDVRANGQVAFSGLTNPKSTQADLPAGSIKADVVLAGTSTVVIGPATLDLTEGTETIVYAVGSASDKTLTLVTQTISGLHSAPGGVNAGSGGLLDRSPGTPGWVWPAGIAALLAALVGLAGLLRTVRPARGRR
jgi:hypothetical protein